MVLACSHRRSLQLLSRVGGNQARSDARSEFEILEGDIMLAPLANAAKF